METKQLLSFKVENFRSFYKEQTINFQNKSKPRTVTAIYGPNASGKSNIIKALGFMRWLTLNSTAANLQTIPIEPFMLREGYEKRPSSFEVEFISDSRHFIYGFSVTRKNVEHEYLKEYASTIKKSLRTIFERREGDLIKHTEGSGFTAKLNNLTRPTSLLITKAHENNNEYSKLFFSWILGMNILTGTVDESMQWSLAQLKNNKELATDVINLMKSADLWIRGFNIEDVNVPTELINQLPFSDDVKRNMLNSPERASVVKTIHALRDENQKIIGDQAFDLYNQESSGTKHFFSIAAPIVDTLQKGNILFIDEFNAYLHPDICDFIIRLFKSDRNPHNAQLVVSTHDTSLMSEDGPLDREDILFVEKNQTEESFVTALSDKSERLDARFEKRYRQGLYGAKPQVEMDM